MNSKFKAIVKFNAYEEEIHSDFMKKSELNIQVEHKGEVVALLLLNLRCLGMILNIKICLSKLVCLQIFCPYFS